MFCYIVDTEIWQMGLFDVHSAFIYFCFVYPIYIFNKLNLLQKDGKTYNLDISL